jgi:hypothetical protein
LLKTIGYSISSLSVLCLGAVSWQSASQKPAMLLLLILGMATSILGMGLRWASFAREQKAKGKGPQELEGRRPQRAAAAGSRQTRISK